MVTQLPCTQITVWWSLLHSTAICCQAALFFDSMYAFSCRNPINRSVLCIGTSSPNNVRTCKVQFPTITAQHSFPYKPPMVEHNNPRLQRNPSRGGGGGFLMMSLEIIVLRFAMYLFIYHPSSIKTHSTSIMQKYFLKSHAFKRKRKWQHNNSINLKDKSGVLRLINWEPYNKLNTVNLQKTTAFTRSKQIL